MRELYLLLLPGDGIHPLAPCFAGDTIPPMRLVLLLALLAGAFPGAARAQGVEPLPDPDSTSVPADSTSTAVADTLLTEKPQLVRAVAELFILNAVAVGINNVARDIPTTRPATWWRNLRGGWEWDGNYISTNNIEHPYAGAVYYNIARSNKLSFWAAAPVTVAGSLIWELFGEPAPPAINDLIVTSLSGITLGEATRRLSLIVLDNQATGVDRVWREAAVLLFNPGMGIDRLSRGQTWHQRPNPLDRRPGALRAVALAGGKRMTLPGSPATGTTSTDVAMAAFGIQYGNPFDGGPTHPFSYFTFTAELNSGPTTTLTELGTRGMLAPLARATAGRQVSGVFMDFEYQWNEAYQFSYQSFGLGLLSRTSGSRWHLDTDVSAEFVPLLASSDPYAEDRVSRSYDYGVGVGARAFGQLAYRGFRVLSVGYRGYWAPTINGASQSKLVQFATVEARAPLPLGLAAGAAYTMYLQRSTYADRAATTMSLPALSLFISTSGR